MRSRPPGLDRILRFTGEGLAGLRRFQGLSQGELAERTGLHRNTIANIERGERDSSILAVSLMQIQLRAGGATVEAEGFLPCPSGADPGAFPFPNLVLAPSVMARVMGDSVRRRRLELGMSLDELARATGAHLNTLWNFERGLVAPSTSTTYLIYRGLGVRRVGGSEQGLVFD
jgi:transcriptional regulator with XRE-family HTH domain